MEATVNIDTVLQAKGRQVETTLPDTPILDVAQQMRVRRIGALVVSRDGSHIAGIISERDIVLGLAHDGPNLLRMKASQVMTKSVITCSPSDSIGHVMAVMTERRVRHLPVVDAGRLCGMISIGDIVKNRLQELELQTNVMRDMYLAGH
jgi:CBS domain-containing protein